MKILSGIAAMALAACALQAPAQSYPARPVRMVVAFPPGSATDIVGRLIAAKVTELWGQNVLPDNRGGAGGSIASALVAKAPPDGYTLFINSNAHVVNPSIYATLPYDTLKDFTDIMPIVGQPNVLLVNPKSAFTSLSVFLAQAKEKPGKINFAYAGLGSGTHLNTEKLKMAAKIDVTLVAYKGTAEAIVDILGGRVDTYFTPISAALPFIKEGRLRPLAVTSAKRAPQLPDVPTIAEAALPGFQFILWFGLWGPAGMPATIVSKVHTDFTRALADAAVREKLSALGNETMSMSPAEFRKFVRQEIAETAKIFQAAGIKPQ